MFNEKYLQIITEAQFNLYQLKPLTKRIPSVEEVQTELLKLFKFNTWKEFIESQRPGQCTFISKAVCRLFPKFQLISCYTKFSPEALNALNLYQEDYSTHFLNKIRKYLL